MEDLNGHTIIGMLRAEMAELRAEVTRIDEHGTRYLPVTAEKAIDLAHQVTALTVQHEADITRLEDKIAAQVADRTAAARWQWGMIVGMMTSLLGLLAIIIEQLIVHHIF